VWGVRSFFSDFRETIGCYIALPVITNVMFFMLIVGSFVLLRPLIIVLHFRFGPAIWRWIRRKGPCFRRFDPVPVTKRFPEYGYTEYQDLVRDARKSLGQEPSCPICCETYGASTTLVVLPCNIKHAYHSSCVKEWLEKHQECPLCKAKVFESS